MLFHSTSDESTVQIRDWNELCSAAIEKEHIETVGRLARQEALQPFLRSNRYGASVPGLRTYFDACHDEIDLTSILYMVAGAEARIRTDAIERAVRRSDPLGQALARLHDHREPEWRMPFKDGILDAWKMYARAEPGHLEDADYCVQAIGRFTDALRIRHWIAHGRCWKIDRPVTDEAVVQVALATDKLIESLRKLAELGQIAPFA